MEYTGNGLYWKGHAYIECIGEYSEGKTLAMNSEGNWQVNAVKEDPSNTFVVKRSFLDQYLCVREDYTIPKNGEITGVFWNGEKISDPLFCLAFSEIYENDGETFTYETERIYSLTETQNMGSVYICYEGCPVGTEYAGYMGIVNGIWIKTVDISSDDRNEDGSPKPYTVVCKIIPDEYIPVLQKYFT